MHTSSLRVELIYDRTCPNVDRARATIRAALIDVGLSPDWTEWDRDDTRTPAEFRGFGSPTILVNGRDVSGAEDFRAEANSCRVYADEEGGLSGVPSMRDITRAIRDAQTRGAPASR